MTYYGIEATHVGMCKFDGSLAPGYRNLAASLREWVGAATPVVEARWREEDVDRRARLLRAQREAQDLIVKLGGASGRSSPVGRWQQQGIAGYGGGWQQQDVPAMLPAMEGDYGRLGPLGCGGGVPVFAGERVVEVEEDDHVPLAGGKA